MPQHRISRHHSLRVRLPSANVLVAWRIILARLPRSRVRRRRNDLDKQRYRDHDMALIEPSIGTMMGRKRCPRRSKPADYKWESIGKPKLSLAIKVR